MLSSEVKTAYDDFYTNNDVAWRMLGAKYKATNLIEVCKGINPIKILEVGAGDGSILHYLNEWKFGQALYALEIAQSGVDKIMARKLGRLVDAQTFDGYKIPYPDNSFDLIILAHVLEHVEHERILIRELKRVAKYIVIEVPRDYRYGVDRKIKHFLDYGHINMYTPTALRFLLKSEGLTLLADKTSMIKPEVSFFNDFKNRKLADTLIRRMKIIVSYQIKYWIGIIFGQKQQEKFANAYTVLTQKSDQDLQIF